MKFIHSIKDQLLLLVLFFNYKLILSFYGERIWNYLIQYYTEFELLCYGTGLFSLIWYILIGSLFALIDFYKFNNNNNNNQLITIHKIQPKIQPDWTFYKKALPTVLFNLIILGIPFGYLFFYLFHPTSPFNNNSNSINFFSKLPTTFDFFYHLLIFILIEEVLFYYFHRLLHWPSFYVKFHKKHHEFTAPIGISAIYTTSLDFLLSNLFPLLIGPILLQSHPFIVWFYFSIAIINTISTHSGYQLFGFPNPKQHDFHHESFNSMFGVLGILDWLHGTDIAFYQKYNKKES